MQPLSRTIKQALILTLSASVATVVLAQPVSAAECKPGTTKRIAFMMKQQTAFRSEVYKNVPDKKPKCK